MANETELRLLPGGLIHAVHTKIPTSMIMTNILHDYNIVTRGSIVLYPFFPFKLLLVVTDTRLFTVTEIKVWELERDLRSPKSYLMPGFVWCVGYIISRANRAGC